MLPLVKHCLASWLIVLDIVPGMYKTSWFGSQTVFSWTLQPQSVPR